MKLKVLLSSHIGYSANILVHGRNLNTPSTWRLTAIRLTLNQIPIQPQGLQAVQYHQGVPDTDIIQKARKYSELYFLYADNSLYCIQYNADNAYNKNVTVLSSKRKIVFRIHQQPQAYILSSLDGYLPSLQDDR